MSEVRFDGKTAIVTGAGGALGGAYAKLLASRGANVVVNDLGGSTQGAGASSSAADKMVEEIKATGGNAIADYRSVTDMGSAQAIIDDAKKEFGGVHILINNAGILRDKSFSKMTEDDWDQIFMVHMKGAFCMTKAVWEDFKSQAYGRIIMTSSASGLYGNFGQSNYSAAKMGLVGMGQTLAAEGAKYNVHTNIIAPMARSRMTEDILPKEILDRLQPEAVAPVVAYLCAEECEENGAVFEAGAGKFIKAKVFQGGGYRTANSDGIASLEELRDNWAKVSSLENPKMITGIQDASMSLAT